MPSDADRPLPDRDLDPVEAEALRRLLVEEMGGTPTDRGGFRTPAQRKAARSRKNKNRKK